MTRTVADDISTVLARADGLAQRFATGEGRPEWDGPIAEYTLANFIQIEQTQALEAIALELRLMRHMQEFPRP